MTLPSGLGVFCRQPCLNARRKLHVIGRDRERLAPPGSNLHAHQGSILDADRQPRAKPGRERLEIHARRLPIQPNLQILVDHCCWAGTSLSTSPGASCPSDYANGHKGVLIERLGRENALGPSHEVAHIASLVGGVPANLFVQLRLHSRGRVGCTISLSALAPGASDVVTPRRDN